MPQTSPRHHLLDFLLETSAFHQTVIYLLTAEIAIRESPESKLFKEHAGLMKIIEGAYESPKHYITSRLFISHVAAFELFLQGILVDVLMKNPKKVGDVQFRLTDVLDAGSTNTLVQRAIDQMLNKLMYKKPLEYLTDVCSFLSIDREPLINDWCCFVEIKARRDLGVHNGWICNATYLRKLAEANVVADAAEGDSMAPVNSEYLRQVHDVFDRLSQQITVQVLKKHWPEMADEYEDA
jgi:hypothetical protein